MSNIYSYEYQNIVKIFLLYVFSPSDASVISDAESDKYLLYGVILKLSNVISQQWIGNEVTMSNWYETWLQEGFNVFFQIQCVYEVCKHYEV